MLCVIGFESSRPKCYYLQSRKRLNCFLFYNGLDFSPIVTLNPDLLIFLKILLICVKLMEKDTTLGKNGISFKYCIAKNYRNIYLW